jgi:hypothetical protein
VIEVFILSWKRLNISKTDLMVRKIVITAKMAILYYDIAIWGVDGTLLAIEY